MYDHKKPRKSAMRTQTGASLLELLMAIVISGITFSAVCKTLFQYGNQFQRQQAVSSVRQESRIAFEVLSSDLRMAGTGGAPGEPAFLKTEKNDIRFNANLGGFQTVLTQAALSGQQDLIVQNGSGWPEGKQVVLCSIEQCVSNRLARNGRSNALQLTDPLSTTLPVGTAIFVSNRVRYYLGQDEQGTPRVMREVDGGTGTLISDIDNLQFGYFGKNGYPATHKALIARIRVTAALKDVTGVTSLEIGLQM